MNDLDFSFEAAPWETYLDTLKDGDTVSAAALLTMMEGEDESTFEDALQELTAKGVLLDISDLPKGSYTGQAAIRLRQEQQLADRGLPFHELEPGDPLRLYLEEIAMTPAAGDEQLLALRATEGDGAAREMLTNLSLSRVIELAKVHTGYGVLLLDLIQEGSLGMWQAVSTYQEGDFASFRDRHILASLAQAITLQARALGVGQKMRTALEDYKAVDERLLSELGRNPTPEEIGEAMHLTAEAAAAVGKMLENARRLQQAKQEPDPEEEEEAQNQSVEDTAYFQTRQRVNEMLSGLTELETRVISLRFGLEGGLPLSPEDTGRKLGLTPDEVVALETGAMAKMRKR